jgi:hypothetical protein
MTLEQMKNVEAIPELIRSGRLTIPAAENYMKDFMPQEEIAKIISQSQAAPPAPVPATTSKTDLSATAILAPTFEFKLGGKTWAIPQPNAGGEFDSPASGAKWVAGTYGIPQTPLKGKRPFLDGWTNQTSLDFDQIDAWAAENPGCNFGSVAKAEPNGFFVFEVDSLATTKKAEADGVRFSSQYMVMSRPHRGHRWYPHSAESLALGNIGQVQNGDVDFSLRAHNEQCVSPGSVHPDTGKQYRIVKHGTLGFATAEEIAWWRSQAEKVSTPALDNDDYEIPAGSRNKTLASIAGKYREAGANREEIATSIHRINSEHCNPPLSEGEVDGIAQSVSKYKVGDPRLKLIMGGTARLEDNVEHVEELPYKIVGLVKAGQRRSDTLCLFSDLDDAEHAKYLGFDSAAVLDKVDGDGAELLLASITRIKHLYKRVAVFDHTPGCELVQSKIRPGSVFVSMPLSNGVPMQHFAEALFESDDEIRASLNEQIHSPELQRTSILLNEEDYRARAVGTLRCAINMMNDTEKLSDPRQTVSAVIDGLQKLSTADCRSPRPLTRASLYGILGDYVELVYPHTEACRELILGAIIPMLGAFFGLSGYGMFGNDKHPASFLCMGVAGTGDGKGQAQNHAIAACHKIDPATWSGMKHASQASGQGLMTTLDDEGWRNHIAGIRKVLVYNELSACLKVQGMEHSILSEVIRDAFDGVRLENGRSNKRDRHFVENYVLGIWGCITPDVLKEILPAIQWKDGSVNRFLWWMPTEKRSIKIAGAPDFKAWAARIWELVKSSLCQTQTQVIQYSPEGARTWSDWIDSLPGFKEGTRLADSQARVKALAFRLAVLYVLLDERRIKENWTPQIEPIHLQAAFEIIGFSRSCVESFLGADALVSSGLDPEDEIKLKLALTKVVQENGKAELTQGAICKMFNHKTKEQRDRLCLAVGLTLVEGAMTNKGRQPGVWKRV